MLYKKSNLFSKITFSITVLSSVLFSSCEDETDPLPQTRDTIVDIATASNDFNTLVSAVQEADLVTALSSPGPFTVFAPSDDGFDAFLSANGLTAEELLADPNLENILSYHVTSGAISSSDVEVGPVTALNQGRFYISADPVGKLWINGSAEIIATDISASNGIIHVLDNVIIQPSQTIAEIAVEATTASQPEFTQLVAALTRAGLVESVSGDQMDDLTVFAPTDAAFENLYNALEVDGIDDIPLDLLTNVLLYHVVPARAFSQDLRQGANLPTLLEGESLMVDLENLQINESGLVPTALNIHGTNGVIHAIDRVLLPPTE